MLIKYIRVDVYGGRREMGLEMGKEEKRKRIKLIKTKKRDLVMKTVSLTKEYE